MHLKQPVLNARVNAGGDDALDVHAHACKGVLFVTVIIFRVMPRACRKEGVGWSCVASSVPERTFRHGSSRSARASSS